MHYRWANQWGWLHIGTPWSVRAGLEPKPSTVLSGLFTVSNNIFLAPKSNSSFLEAVSWSHVLTTSSRDQPIVWTLWADLGKHVHLLEGAFNDLVARDPLPLNGGNEVTINFCHCHGTPFNNHDREQMRCEIDSVMRC